MQAGDLIRVLPCQNPLICGCFLCDGNSNGIGVVIKDMDKGCGTWAVLFDCGEWEIHWTELLDDEEPNAKTKIISKRR